MESCSCVGTGLNPDYRDPGEGYLLGHLDSYRRMIPTSSEHPDCGDFLFQNLAGDEDRVEVNYIAASGFEVSKGKYTGLRSTKGKLRIIANGRERYSKTGPVGSVYQDIEMLRIPIFQFAVFYNMNMEIDNGPNTMTITGPVHCNTNVYLDPYNTLTFNSDVTASGRIAEFKMPGNPMSSPGSGAIVYNAAHDSQVSTLNLPLGTNTSPGAIHALIEIPPPLEDPYSSMGRQRYYNKADLIIIVQDTNIVATSGLRNSDMTVIPGNEITNFVSTNVTFYNKRERKNINSTGVNIGRLIEWNATNTYLRPWLPGLDIKTVFVADQRTQSSSTQSGVRLINGQTLLPQGLTVATPNPVYTLGHYNSPAAHLGTTNTSASLPSRLDHC